MKKIITAFLLGTGLLLNGAPVATAQSNVTRGNSYHLPNHCLLVKTKRVTQEDCPIGQDPVVRTHHKEVATKQANLAKQKHQTTTPKTTPSRGVGQGAQDGTGPLHLQDSQNCPQQVPPTTTTPPPTETAPSQDVPKQEVNPQSQEGTGNQSEGSTTNRATHNPGHNRQNTPNTTGHGRHDGSGTGRRNGHHGGY